ncbi:MAG: Hpt domain-containing protein [Pseudomonadota bacterium]
MVNWSRVAQLKDEVGEDVFPEVIAIFIEETDEVAERIGPAESLEADMHFLKGAALNLGLDDLAKLAAEGEAQAAGRAEGTPDVARVVATYQASRDALLEHAQTEGVAP